MSERTVRGLLRLIGLPDAESRDLTAEEADMVFEVLEAEPVPAERLARIRERVLQRIAEVPRDA